MGDIDNLMPKNVYPILHGLCHKINDIAGLRGGILMLDSVLETLLVVDYVRKISS
jgi:hypothetical protein